MVQHLYAAVGFMRAASSWEQFKWMIDRAFPRKGKTGILPFSERPAST